MKTMEKVKILFMAGIMALLVACQGNTSQGHSGATHDGVEQEDAQASLEPIVMQVSEVSQPVTLGKKEYQSSVVRRPDADLPMVSNQQGQKFVDNRITLLVTEGTRQVVRKEFTKADFLNYLDAGFQKNAILEGLVFDKSTPQGLLYAASVAYPESDLYVPFQITVNANGGINIVKSDEMDEYEAPRDTTALEPNVDEKE